MSFFWKISTVAAVGALIALVGLFVATSLHDGAFRFLAMSKASVVATGSAESDGESAVNTLRYLVEHTPIPPQGVQGDPAFTAVIDDHAWGTLMRGRAYCDSLAMAYIQLIEQAGLEGQLLFLRDESETSPHTVATVRVDGEWLVVDALYGAIPVGEGGEWLSAQEMAQLGRDGTSTGYRTTPPRVIQGYSDSFVPTEWFSEATVFYETDTNSKSFARDALERVLRPIASQVLPVVSSLRQVFNADVAYLRSKESPVSGDVAYAGARQADLLGESQEAKELLSEAESSQTQWSERIATLRNQEPVEALALLSPVVTDTLTVPESELAEAPIGDGS